MRKFLVKTNHGDLKIEADYFDINENSTLSFRDFEDQVVISVNGTHWLTIEEVKPEDVES